MGLVIGTPEYLSPEQALGMPVQPGSDLYSLGVLAFRMLSGVLPFPGPTPRQFLAQHVNTPPLDLSQVAPQLASHARLAKLVMWCLQKEIADRPSSAAAVIETLTGQREVPEPTAKSSDATWVRAPESAASVQSLRKRLQETWPTVRKPLTVAVLVAVLAAVGFAVFRPSTASRVRQLLDEGRPKEALHLLEEQARASQGKLPAASVGLKAAALHKEGTHSEELDVLEALSGPEQTRIDTLALEGLAEDYAKGPTDALERVLSGFPKGWLEDEPLALPTTTSRRASGAPCDTSSPPVGRAGWIWSSSTSVRSHQRIAVSAQRRRTAWVN